MTYILLITKHDTEIFFDSNLTDNQVREILEDYPEYEYDVYIDVEMEDIKDDQI